ncbi:hypothetical protein HYY74_07890 [Candidatus Woesearchaeota archaeon]|nr:hypothetical protein [Candidatus Woesearchaeota archaeon]
MLKVMYTVLSNRKYLAIAIFSTISLMILYIISLSSVVLKSFDIITDTAMLSSIFSGGLLQLILIGVLTILFGIWLAMQLYLRWENKEMKATPIAAASGSVFSGFLGGLGALGGCPACLVIITAVIGSTATAFLLQYRTPIVLLAIALSVLSIYITSKSIENKCGWCK